MRLKIKFDIILERPHRRRFTIGLGKFGITRTSGYFGKIRFPVIVYGIWSPMYRQYSKED